MQKLSRPNPRGFTLIEVLIVMVIISIVGGVAVLTLSHNQNARLENLAKQLVNVITLAEEQAMLQPAVLGLTFTTNTFQFYQYQERTRANQNPWHAVDERALGLHHLPDNTQLTLIVSGKSISLAKTAHPNMEPQLIISNSGDLTPFTLLIGKPDTKPRYEVNGEANGNITYRDHA